MPDTPPEDLIRQLQEELERERERADRARIEANIVWNALSTFRELVVRYRFQGITMTQGYEPIRALEGSGLDEEIERQYLELRARRAAKALIREGEQLAASIFPDDLPEED